MRGGEIGESKYLNPSDKQTKTALDKCRAHQRAHRRDMRRILVQSSSNPRDLVRPPPRLLRRHPGRDHGDGRHRRVRAVQHDHAHVVVHPDARDAVRAVHERWAEGRHFRRGEVGAHWFKVWAEAGAEDVEGGANLFPFADGGRCGGVEVGVVEGVTGGGGLAGRAEAAWDGDAARGGHQAGERGRGVASADSRTWAWAWSWPLSWWWSWTTSRSTTSLAWGPLGFSCLAFPGQVARGKVR